MTGISRYFAMLKKTSPVAAFPGCALLIIASGRFSHAITVAGALIWVFGLTTLVIYTASKIFPRYGRTPLIFFLASFLAAAYLFILWLLSPLCALEIFFAVSLVPVFYMMSGVSKRLDALSAADSFFSSSFEAFSLGVLILAFALIREPAGFVSLSLPGGAQGSVMLFSFRVESFVPIQLLASSGGALLLLGYFWGLYKLMNKVQGGDKNAQ
ncbi:MAG: hypothetical protein LBU85_10450 [Treponema sp.]|jgi:hypothetical protein|nr:hypothetical protein [Treponema sp.]